MSRTPHTIFVSYSRHDGNVTYDLADSLRADGHTVWTDVSGIPGGAIWLFEIEKAITACDVFVVMISRGAKESPWVMREILFALDLRKRIIPVRLEDVTLPFALYELQPINYFAAPMRAAQDLLAALSSPASQAVSSPMTDTPSVSLAAAAKGLSLVDFRRYLLTSPDEETQ